MIDPDIQAFIEASEGFYPPDAASLPVAGQRALYDAYARAFAVRRPATVASADATLVLADRHIPLRLYRDTTRTAKGLVLYAHGGGFMLGSLDSHDGIVARLCGDTGAAVVAIDYRLAPECLAPAAWDDVVAVVLAAADGTLPWTDLPREKIGLAGDSAGASVMASAALQIGRARPGAVAALALVYPALGFEPAEPARSAEADAPMLTLADVHFYRSIYLDDQAPPAGTFVLDDADLSALPPTVLLPAEHDPLRDDCTVLAGRLSGQGTDVLLLPGTGLVHGCLRALDRSAAIAEPFARLCAFVAEHLSASA